jgi:hypothetical protein
MDDISRGDEEEGRKEERKEREELDVQIKSQPTSKFLEAATNLVPNH